MDKYLSGTVKFILGNATSNFPSSEFLKEAMEWSSAQMNQTSMYTSMNNTIKQVQNKKEQSKSGNYIIYTIFIEKKVFTLYTQEKDL